MLCTRSDLCTVHEVHGRSYISANDSDFEDLIVAVSRLGIGSGHDDDLSFDTNTVGYQSAHYLQARERGER